jgi:hypothetical protein
MTQTPHDQLAKQYLEEFLAPFGRIERQYEIPGEAKYVDVWFIPNPTTATDEAELGILGRMTETMCLLEPYRNAPTRNEIRTSILKLLWVQDNEQRIAQPDDLPLTEDNLPRLWILAATVSAPVLTEASGLVKADWLPGIYFMADLLKVAIVAIDQLPETDETLWLRILGRGPTQERAIREVLALPESQAKRNRILQLLASWKVRMDMSELNDFSSQEEIMAALTEALTEWEIQIKKTIALNLLSENLPLEVVVKTTGLSIEQVQQLQTQATQN